MTNEFIQDLKQFLKDQYGTAGWEQKLENFMEEKKAQHENNAILANYKDSCSKINAHFAQKYFTDEEGDTMEWWCVSDEPDESMNISDYYFSFDERKTALELNIPWETLNKWYDNHLNSYTPCTQNCQKRKQRRSCLNLKTFYKLTKSNK